MSRPHLFYNLQDAMQVLLGLELGPLSNILVLRVLLRLVCYEFDVTPRSYKLIAIFLSNLHIAGCYRPSYLYNLHKHQSRSLPMTTAFLILRFTEY